MKAIQKHWQRYLISSLISFLTGALIAILPYLENWEAIAWDKTVIVGMAVAVFRAGVKALIEYVLPHLKELVVLLKTKL